MKKLIEITLTNKGDFGLIGQFFLRLSLINFTSGSGRLEKADEDFKKQGELAQLNQQSQFEIISVPSEFNAGKCTGILSSTYSLLRLWKQILNV